ncbi:MAG: methyltransferase domain-containing protein [Ferruginibacter sp.]
MELDDQYWSGRYIKNESQWDLGAISTPLKDYIDQLNELSVSILIPGGGNSYEADYLLKNGYTDVTVVDISAVICSELEEKYKAYSGKELKIVHADFFSLEGQYDLILEQTFFCALDPSLRKNYVLKMYELLKPNGKLVGLLFNRSFESSPPFSGSKEEYLELFAGEFDIEIMEDCYNSIERRKGTELFIKLKKHESI